MFGVYDGRACSGRLYAERRGATIGESEIENFGVAAIGDKNVGRLDVAMDDTFGVGGVESLGDFDGSERTSSISMGRPAMQYLRVRPLRSSMAMKCGRSLRRCRVSCRYWDDSARKLPGPRGGNG